MVSTIFHIFSSEDHLARKYSVHFSFSFRFFSKIVKKKNNGKSWFVVSRLQFHFKYKKMRKNIYFSLLNLRWKWFFVIYFLAFFFQKFFFTNNKIIKKKKWRFLFNKLTNKFTIYHFDVENKINWRIHV